MSVSMAFDDLDMPSGQYRDVVGGSATYASYASSVLAPTRVVGVVGDDFSDRHLRAMSERGIDTSGVERVPGKTFRWHGRYSEDLASRETLDTQLNVFADFRPKVPAAYRSSEFVLLGNIHPALQLEVLEQVDSPLHRRRYHELFGSRASEIYSRRFCRRSTWSS